MADTDAVDEIVAQCNSWIINPLPIIGMLWWESGGLSRSITFTDDDGTLRRSFKGGDYSQRLNGEWGVCSYGSCQIYANVHGPFTDQVTTHQIGIFKPGSRIPDYVAAAKKWDNVTLSMQYLAVNGPNGGWLNVYRSCPYNYDIDPINFLLWFCKRAQGSIPWETWMAIEAESAAREIYSDYLIRHTSPTPVPVAPVDLMEIIYGITYGIQGLESTRDQLNAQIEGYKSLIEYARR